jgi:tyrosine-protein phosphatase YwqE
MSSLKKTYEIISKKFGAGVAEDLLINNPYSIIKGRDVLVEEPVKPIKRKWFRWFG